MRYAATMDNTCKLITNIIIMLVLAIAVRQITDISHTAVTTTILLFVLIPAVLLSWGFSPKYYLLTDDAIIMKGRLHSINIPLADVLRLRSIDEEELGKSIRLFGSGGLFGYLGSYQSSEIGRYKRWCTNMQSLVLIESQDAKWVISPSDPGDFVRSVNKIINAIE
ncbi:PH domain-containing protein [Chitinophaga vietnamensis]|uniref:PH domain-containing protein n=1 Tax=Chitinophaga vietnamensis TaxID=2593957 RepID=UPI001177C11E|nr:PH domain-containing protein [Chitinophaga vietnamensis]